MPEYHELDRMTAPDELIRRGKKNGALVQPSGGDVYYRGKRVARSLSQLERMIRRGEQIGEALNTEFGEAVD